MTILNANALANLRAPDSGVPVFFVTQLENLLNNPAMASLEKLRQELNAGTVTVRLPRPGEVVPNGAHAYYDNNQGLVIQPEYLQRYSQLPQAIDDLAHEFRHYQLSNQRDNVYKALETSSDSLSARTNDFIKSMLDDETAGRLAGYRALKELPEEYSGSAQRQIAASELYRKFAELEALGKTDSQLIEESRSVMAGYSQGKYVDDFFNTVKTILRLGADDVPALYEQLKTTYPNALGYTETEEYFSDGSSQYTIEHADGSVEKWIYDAAGNLYVSPNHPLSEWANASLKSLAAELNTFFLAARNVIIRSDPLVLDLDGDGLELSGASGNILFDHNADGIKTGTGWARPDDGFLVRDINNNGTIDSGRELFGIDTLKSNGALATNGFDALKDLDSNNDGFITSADAAFDELKVWQDANQDGITQSGELKTLAQLGITSIGVNGSATGTQAGQIINNNKVALSATYTRDGITRTVGAIDLETNNFFTEFPPEVIDETGNPVAISDQAQALPQMNGSGMVRNLRAAATLSTSFMAIEARNDFEWRVFA